MNSSDEAQKPNEEESKFKVFIKEILNNEEIQEIFKTTISNKVVAEIKQNYPEVADTATRMLRILANAGKLGADTVPFLGTAVNAAELYSKDAGINLTPDVERIVDEKLGPGMHDKIKTVMFVLDTITTFLPLPLASIDNAIQIVVDLVAIAEDVPQIIGYMKELLPTFNHDAQEAALDFAT